MKRFAAIILSISMLLFSFSVCAFAADEKSRIFSQAVTASPGDSVNVDVKIENNTGFMGFELSVSYDSEKLTPISVTKGELLSGMLDDSIETSQQAGTYKIVYSGASEAKDDGVIVTLAFKVSDSADADTKIILSSEADGFFDEQYSDVAVAFEPIIINLNQKDFSAMSIAELAEYVVDSVDIAQTDSADYQKLVIAKYNLNQAVASGDSEKIAKAWEEFENASEKCKADKSEALNILKEKVNSECEKEKDLPLSEKIRLWADGLSAPFNTIMGVIVAPLVWIISLFE